MKFPIEWHENCLKNMKANLDNEQKILKDQQERVNRRIGDILFLENQLECAKADGKDGFDAYKYKKIKVN